MPPLTTDDTKISGTWIMSSILTTFTVAKPGFAGAFQFVNVDALAGKGETTPTAYFYQTVGEAEYMVALFQHMVLIGYPPRPISILTTYIGQKC